MSPSPPCLTSWGVEARGELAGAAARIGNFLGGRFCQGEGEPPGVWGVRGGEGAVAAPSLLSFVSRGGETRGGTVGAAARTGMIDGRRAWWGEGGREV